MFNTKYRVVKDSYCGFECQFKWFWMPFYIQMNFPSTNTHMTLDDAKKFIDESSVVAVATYTKDT